MRDCLTPTERRAAEHALQHLVRSGDIPAPELIRCDLLQSAAVALWLSKEKRGALPEFGAAFAQARWAMLDELRRWLRRRAAPEIQPMPQSDAHHETPERILAAKQALVALDALTDRQREILAAYMEHDDPRERKRLTGVGTSRVQQVKDRARELMAAAI